MRGWGAGLVELLDPRSPLLHINPGARFNSTGTTTITLEKSCLCDSWREKKCCSLIYPFFPYLSNPEGQLPLEEGLLYPG